MALEATPCPRYERGALPLGRRLNRCRPLALASLPIDWLRERDSNSRPWANEAPALPTELSRVRCVFDAVSASFVAFSATATDAILWPGAAAGTVAAAGGLLDTCCEFSNLRELIVFTGSSSWVRTSDILINSQALYRLSYRGMDIWLRGQGSNLRTVLDGLQRINSASSYQLEHPGIVSAADPAGREPTLH